MRTTLRLLRFVLAHPLAGRAPLASLARVLRWQLRSRLGDGEAVAPFVGPTRLLLRRGLSSATAAHYAGLTDFAEMGFLLHLLRPDDLFADVGANVGVWTVLASGVCGARTVAAEPAAETLRHLDATIALNGLTALVEPRAVALGAAPGRLPFTTGRGATNRLAAPGEAVAVREVPVETLDSLFADRAPLLLKVDVEGAEAAVLAGGARVLADPALKAAILETSGHGDRLGADSGDAAVHAAMAAAGFAAHDYDPFTRALTPRAGPGRPNTLYLRDAGFARARLAAAPPFAVHGRAI
jgi:FkbM family methyltransferase